MDALQQRQAFHQPADPVVHGEPGFAGPGVSMAATPATHRFLEGRGEPAVATPTIGSRIGRHGWILIGLTPPTPTLPRGEAGKIMPECGSARSWPRPIASRAATRLRPIRRSTSTV